MGNEPHSQATCPRSPAGGTGSSGCAVHGFPGWEGHSGPRGLPPWNGFSLLSSLLGRKSAHQLSSRREKDLLRGGVGGGLQPVAVQSDLPREGRVRSSPPSPDPALFRVPAGGPWPLPRVVHSHPSTNQARPCLASE